MIFSYLADRREQSLREANRIGRRLEALAQDEPAAVSSAWAAAWDRRHRAGLIGAGLVALRHGLLRNKDMLRLALTLHELGQHAKALKVLDRHGPPDGDHPGYWSCRSGVLAALGRFDAAAEAGERLPGAVKPAEWRRLARALADVGPQSPWEDQARLAASLRAEGAIPLAAEIVARLAATSDQAAPDVELLTAVAHMALEYGLADAAGPLIAAIGDLAGPEATLPLELEQALRLGQPKIACAQASRIMPRDHLSGRLYAEALAQRGRRREAITRLARLSRRPPATSETSAALNRMIGEDVIDTVKPRFATRVRRKVLNFVPFNDEIDLLHLRFSEMYPWVDQFVIVESRSTFTGKPKPLHFEENKDQFARYMRKVSHVVIDEFPAHITSAWAKDFYQRDMAIQGVNGAWAADDIVLLTDADEIVRREVLDAYFGGVLALRMMTYRYFLNYGALPGTAKANGHTGTICTAEHLARYGSSYVRFVESRTSKIADAISNAGWHFTSVGDALRIAGKFGAYAHEENSDLAQETTMQGILDAIRAGRHQAGWAPLAIDDSFPRFVRKNRDRLSDLILAA